MNSQETVTMTQYYFDIYYCLIKFDSGKIFQPLKDMALQDNKEKEEKHT